MTTRVAGRLHDVEDQWLLSRVLPWCVRESEGKPMWITALKSDGTFYDIEWQNGSGQIKPDRIDHARRVCAFLNREVGYGGAWMVGWFDAGRTFYMLWKDSDGDIRVPVECTKPWSHIREWPMETWGEHAEQALMVTAEVHRAVDIGPEHTKKLAQGEPLSPSDQ